jgi:tetratricopeptide (TPR) repeat protein
MTDPPAPTPGDLAARVASLSRQVPGLLRAGAVAEALQAADDLLGIDEAALATVDPAAVRELLDVAGTLLEAGDLGRAERLLVHGINALSRNPAATRVELVVPLSNLMALYDRAGDPGRRDHVGAMLGSLAEQIDEPLPRAAMLVFFQLGRIYGEAGSTDVALLMYRQVHRYMTTAEQDPETVHGWLLHYVTTLRAGGRHGEVVEACRLALSTLDRIPGADRADAIELFVAMAAAAGATGDRALARSALEDAARTAEETVGDGQAADPKHQAAAGAAYHNLAVLYAEEGPADRYGRAEELVRRALAIVLRTGGEGSAEHAGELGQLAVVAQKRGHVDAAERAYVESIAVYDRAPDTDPVELSNFLTDLGLLRLRLGRPGDAVPPLRRTAELRDVLPTETPARRADARSNLATAHLEAGDLEAAIRDYGRAVDLRLAAPS